MSSAEVAAKLDRVRGWLAGSGYGAALFTSQPSVAWVTGGLEDRVVRYLRPRTPEELAFAEPVIGRS